VQLVILPPVQVPLQLEAQCKAGAQLSKGRDAIGTLEATHELVQVDTQARHWVGLELQVAAGGAGQFAKVQSGAAPLQ